ALFAAIATPSTDPLSMLLLATPISLLYLAACTIAWCNDRRRGRTRDARPDQNPADTQASSLDLTPTPIEPPESIDVSRP
ncbi:twin-arginine translocase subunit TatC, partial [Streptomyces sp. NPDC001070]